MSMRQGFLLVVGHVDKGDAEFLVHLLELDLHILAHLQVEGGERLVEQQDLRLVDQCAGDGHTLLLSAGEKRHVPLLVSLQVHQGEHSRHFLADDVLARLFDPEAEGDIVVNVHVGEQGVALEHGVDLPPVGRHLVDALAVEDHGPFVLLQEAAEDAEQRCLSAAGGPEESDEFIFRDIQVDAFQDHLSVKAFHDVPEFDKIACSHM